jgi:hypothetical protein
MGPKCASGINERIATTPIIGATRAAEFDCVSNPELARSVVGGGFGGLYRGAFAGFAEAVVSPLAGQTWCVMDNVSRTLSVTQDGLLLLFLGAGASVELLASAFETDTHVIESSLREAIRKRDVIDRAASPSTVELLRTVSDAA